MIDHDRDQAQLYIKISIVVFVYMIFITTKRYVMSCERQKIKKVLMRFNGSKITFNFYFQKLNINFNEC